MSAKLARKAYVPLKIHEDTTHPSAHPVNTRRCKEPEDDDPLAACAAHRMPEGTMPRKERAITARMGITAGRISSSGAAGPHGMAAAAAAAAAAADEEAAPVEANTEAIGGGGDRSAGWWKFLLLL